ncbi:MAG: hypothetical protein ACM3KE_09030 [Hyphomicrobiales bacterium]
MSTPETSAATESKTKTGKIVRMVLQWTILGLLVFTCIMAAIRKFGG